MTQKHFNPVREEEDSIAKINLQMKHKKRVALYGTKSILYKLILNLQRKVLVMPGAICVLQSLEFSLDMQTTDIGFRIHQARH